MAYTNRSANPLDHLIVGFDKALRVVGGVAKAARPNPGVAAPDCEMNAEEQRHSAGLMRVNHVGEVCAQALYDAQGRRASTTATSRFDSSCTGSLSFFAAPAGAAACDGAAASRWVKA